MSLPIFQTLREAHFLVAAGHRGGGPHPGRRSDNLPHFLFLATSYTSDASFASSLVVLYPYPFERCFWTGSVAPHLQRQCFYNSIYVWCRGV